MRPLEYGKDYAELRQLVFSLDNGVCHICHKKVILSKSTLDHVVPSCSVGREGIESSGEYWNLRLAHKGCNSMRSNGRTGGQMRLHAITVILPNPNETTLERYQRVIKIRHNRNNQIVI